MVQNYNQTLVLRTSILAHICAILPQLVFFIYNTRK